MRNAGVRGRTGRSQRRTPLSQRARAKPKAADAVFRAATSMAAVTRSFIRAIPFKGPKAGRCMRDWSEEGPNPGEEEKARRQTPRRCFHLGRGSSHSSIERARSEFLHVWRRTPGLVQSHISAGSREVREKREEESRQRWVRRIDDEEEFRKSHISAVSREVREERERRKAANGGSDTLTTRRSKGRSWVFRFCCAAHRRAAAALSPA